MKVCFIDMMNEEENFEVDFINDINIVKRIIKKCKSDKILIGKIVISIGEIFFDFEDRDYCDDYILYMTIMDGSNTVCTLSKKNIDGIYDWSRTIEFVGDKVIIECCGDGNKDFFHNANKLIKK